MRYVCAAAAIALSALIPTVASGQAPALSITSYQLVSETRQTRTASDFEYRADLVNTGPARTAVTASVTSSSPNVQVIKGSLHFANVPANGRATSSDTFTIRVDRSVAFDFASLQWTFPPPADPIANAGPDQTRPVGATVTLNGSGSSNPGGVGTLSYSWAFTTRPAGSTALLNNPASVTPTFVIDVAGAYVVMLTVSNGVANDTASVTISTSNTPPVADAGANQSVAAGATVALNGSKSSDVDGNPLTYSWTLTQKPAGSTAALTNPASVSPSFAADKAGTYVARLIVNDGTANSAPDTVQITTTNTAPVANAGADQTVNAGTVVQLNGSGSTDVDGDPLTYQWTLSTKPAGSTAVLSSSTSVNPTFTADQPGTYVAQLIVNDGKVNSPADTVQITTSDVLAPTANAGADQTVKHGSLVTLNGSGTDPQSRPLTFLWSLLSKPAGSTAVLSSTTVAKPAFTADKPGDYIAQLIVNNGFLNSAPDTVKITTTNTAPVANAGPNQNVAAGATVTLNGTGSSDADGDPLTYAWSLTTRPAGSNAALSGANSATPTFVASLAGTYIAQLIVSDQFASSAPKTVTISVAAGAAASITVTSGGGQSAQINVAFTNRLVATVKDANGNPVSGVTVTFTAPASGASGSFTGGDTAVTTAAGVATSNVFTANGTKGSYIVTAAVPGVATPATFALTNIGGSAASITATSGGGQSIAINTAFPNRLVATVKDAGGNPVSGVTVTFTAPASGASGAFTGGNTAVTTAAGVATSNVFTANGTAGSYNVTASAPGVAAPATFALTNTAGPAASITATSGGGQSKVINTAFPNRLVATVKDAGGNPVSGVTVTFTAPASGASGTFTGSNTAVTTAAGVATSNVFTANATAGSYNVTASAPGVAAPATFALTNTAGPAASITATSGGGQSATAGTPFASRLVATVKDAGGNPVSGVTVTFTPPASGASGAFTGGNTAVTTAAGVATSNVFTANAAGGSYNVTASVPGAGTPATFALTNTVVQLGVLTLTGATVGQNLQTTVTLIMPGPVPTGGKNITITSANPALVKLASSPTAVGANQITINVPAGQTSASNIYVQGFAASGTAQITASGPGYTDGSATIGLTPAGFAIAGPAGLGISSFTVAQGTTNTQLSVSAAQLDSSLNYLSTQQVRGGLTVNVPISNSTPAVGTVAPTTVVIAGGASSGTAVFNALATGSTLLTAGVPSGFVQPGSGLNTLVAIVFSSGLLTQPVTVGENLETGISVRVNTAPSSVVPVTITSNDPSKLLFSLTAEAAGQASVTVNIGAGTMATPTFFAQSLAKTGSATYSATASGYGTTSGTVTFAASGFVIEQPQTDFITTVGAENLDITIQSYRLNGGSPAVVQPVRGGLSVNVPVTSSNQAVGVIKTSPLLFSGGTSFQITQFDPLTTGTTTIAVGTPAGFTMPATDRTRTATIITPSLSLTNGHTIGRNLQASGIVLLGQPAPAGGVPVQMVSNSGQLLLASSPTAAGASSITITVPAGESSALYYLQALGESGTATYTASAPGYSPRTGTMTMAPSGVIIAGPLGFGFPMPANVNGGPQQVSLFTARLGPNNAPVEAQALAGGLSLSVQLSNSNPGVGTVASPATIAGGFGTEGNPAQTSFTPLAIGQAVLSVLTPPGYGTATANTTLVVQVSP